MTPRRFVLSARTAPRRFTCLVVLALLPLPAAADYLPRHEAAALLQRMADASRRLAYEGVFVVQSGGEMQTLAISNRPIGGAKESRLAAMDGVQREVRCTQTGSLSLVSEGGQLRMERRLNSRHFPDLLPQDATPLANWYGVRLGEFARVAGLDCRQVELTPRDGFRWGHVLCAEKDSALPLKAVMVNEQGKPLMQYAFAEIRLGSAPRMNTARALPEVPDSARPVVGDSVLVKQLPPGFSRVTAVRRTLPNRPGEVEHWVFSDGLTHVSLFLENSPRPVETVRGQSKQGMIHLLTRQVGPLRATILGDAPWATVEAIAMNLEARGGER
jgi:sigma-E factor negative regulatory protein RseB